MIPMAHQMVGDYVIIDEARDEENRRHMIMRPYQVYALQAIEVPLSVGTMMEYHTAVMCGIRRDRVKR